MNKKNGKIDWLVFIPNIFCIVCTGVSLRKMFLTGHDIYFIDVLEACNSNVFATYISMVICMAYQFFSVYDFNQAEKSGLSRNWIGLTIIASVIYGGFQLVNACIYNIYTTLAMSVASIIYIFLFFKYMRIHK